MPTFSHNFAPDLFAIKDVNTVITNNTVLAQDPELTLTLQANQRYLLDSLIIMDSSVTAGYKYKLNANTPPMVLWWTSDALSATEEFLAHQNGGIAQSDGTGVGDYLQIVKKGYIRTGPTPIVVSHWAAQRTADNTPTTLHMGSWIRFTQI